MNRPIWSPLRDVPRVEPFESVSRAAIFSPDGVYRYTLTRKFGKGASCLFVMLNPSTAGAVKDDPTIRRCIHFAQREGCAVLRVVNLYAFAASKPRDLWAASDPVGLVNNNTIAAAAERADLIVAAWGAPVPSWNTLRPLWATFKGAVPRRVEVVKAILTAVRPVYCLGLTKAGAPKHPLARGAHRVPDDAPLVLYASKAA